MLSNDEKHMEDLSDVKAMEARSDEDVTDCVNISDIIIDCTSMVFIDAVGIASLSQVSTVNDFRHSKISNYYLSEFIHRLF